jgi:hypothetical protein
VVPVAPRTNSSEPPEEITPPGYLSVGDGVIGSDEPFMLVRAKDDDLVPRSLSTWREYQEIDCTHHLTPRAVGDDVPHWGRPENTTN